MSIKHEAERTAQGVFMDGNPFSNVMDAWTDGYVEGYVAASQREPTEAEIDILQEALYDDNRYGDRAVIRAALLAARNTRETNG